MPNRAVALRVALAAVIGTAAGCSDKLALPECLRSLIASCAPQGACVASGTVEASDICFDSGVRATWATVDVADPTACNLGVRTVTIAKADGAPCYSIESRIDSSLGCEGARYTWKDASGQVVATGQRDYDSNTSITCATTNEVVGCKGPSGLSGGDPCCGITGFGTPVCDYPDRGACAPGACAAAN